MLLVCRALCRSLRAPRALSYNGRIKQNICAIEVFSITIGLTVSIVLRRSGIE